jgi:hypothetical protein
LAWGSPLLLHTTCREHVEIYVLNSCVQCARSPTSAWCQHRRSCRISMRQPQAHDVKASGRKCLALIMIVFLGTCLQKCLAVNDSYVCMAAITCEPTASPNCTKLHLHHQAPPNCITKLHQTAFASPSSTKLHHQNSKLLTKFRFNCTNSTKLLQLLTLHSNWFTWCWS